MDEVVRTLSDGLLAVIPTDTVYGLACAPGRAEAVRSLSALKRRSPDQAVALVASSVDDVLGLIPELPERAVRVSRALLPGAYTLVLPNPVRRFPWLSGRRTHTIGVRVPAVTGEAAEVLAQARVVAATSANLHGGPDPHRLADVPQEILGGVSAVLDGGELPGTPSTVVDLTCDEPRVLREGAVRADAALALIASALDE